MTAMGREFHAAAGWSDVTGFNDDDCAQTLANMVENETAIVVVCEHDGEVIGMAGGVMSPIYFNYGHRSGQELFFWMRPDARNGDGAKLLSELEAQAKLKGCSSWVMIALEHVRPQATGMLYKRRGYRLAEHNWIKRL